MNWADTWQFLIGGLKKKKERMKFNRVFHRSKWMDGSVLPCVKTINFEYVSLWFQISNYVLHNLISSLTWSPPPPPPSHLSSKLLLVSSPGFSTVQCFLSCPTVSRCMVHRLCLRIEWCYGNTTGSLRIPNYRRPGCVKKSFVCSSRMPLGCKVHQKQWLYRQCFLTGVARKAVAEWALHPLLAVGPHDLVQGIAQWSLNCQASHTPS